MRNFKKIMLMVSILTLLASTLVVQATIISGSRSKTSSNNIYVWLDSSVANSTTYNSIYSYARSYWTNTGTNFQGFYVSSTNYQTSDEYYVSTTATSQLWGRTVPYKRLSDGSTTQASTTEYWEFCRVYIFSNQMDAYGFSTEQRRSNAAHEIGHTLKLAHPSVSVTAIMNQGIQSILPQSYDIQELGRKWSSM